MVEGIKKMTKWHYILAVCTFAIFCILWMTYETSFIQAFDKGASDLLYGNEFITMFHYLGEKKFIFSVAAISSVVIWIRVRDYKLMLFVFLTVGCGYALYQSLKRIIERPRPDIADQFTSFSFPSGHALHGFLYLVTIAYVFDRIAASKKASRIVWTATIILSLLIGISRITEGRHYASDVVAGWMLGYSWFILCVWWYESGNPHFKRL